MSTTLARSIVMVTGDCGCAVDCEVDGVMVVVTCEMMAMMVDVAVTMR